MRCSRYSDGLQAGRMMFEFRQGQDFSLLHNFKIGSRAHPAAYPMGTGGLFPGGKAPGA
jgi:hypothetical protein